MIINDKVWGRFEIDKKYECIVNTHEIQRLKNKKQLGMTPGDKAIHTRYDHSVGVYYLACKLVDVVKNKFGKYMDIGEEEDAIKIMALVHDIGHGPFSHLAERLLNSSHEDNTVRLLLGDTEISRAILNNFGQATLDKVIYLIQLKEKIKNNEMINNKLDIMFIISKLLSGGIDIDRIDYIARDSYHVLGKKYDYSEILNYIDLDYVDDYLEIVFQQEATYPIANYLNKRYELYDTLYLSDEKFIVEACLDKLMHKLDYPLTWDTEENDILKYLEVYRNNFDFLLKRYIDIAISRNIDDNIKYMTFNSKEEYLYFLNSLNEKDYNNLIGYDEALITTCNKLNIYSKKNRIYVKQDNFVSDMSDCAILNTDLQRDKFIVVIDFAILDYYNPNNERLDNLRKEFVKPIEVEKKYLYCDDNIECYKNLIKDSLNLIECKNVVNEDTYYDYNNILSDNNITLRNRIASGKNIWNVKQTLSDKSSITKREELEFLNIESALEYIRGVKKINIEAIEIIYSSFTNRELYKINYRDSEFEIAFDTIEVKNNNIIFEMVECELKNGNSVDLYYLNNLMMSFPFLINCSKSKHDIVLNDLNDKVKVRKKTI